MTTNAGVPDCAKTQGWDIQAKVSAADVAARQEMMNLQRETALRALLGERFKLSANKEPKEFPGYALVIAKNGPKLTEAKPGDTYPNGLKKKNGSAEGAGDCHEGPAALTCQSMSMNVLARFLTYITGGTGGRRGDGPCGLRRGATRTAFSVAHPACEAG